MDQVEKNLNFFTSNVNFKNQVECGHFRSKKSRFHVSAKRPFSIKRNIHEFNTLLLQNVETGESKQILMLEL